MNEFCGSEDILSIHHLLLAPLGAIPVTMFCTCLV
jgi:hypothetical protein